MRTEEHLKVVGSDFDPFYEDASLELVIDNKGPIIKLYSEELGYMEIEKEEAVVQVEVYTVDNTGVSTYVETNILYTYVGDMAIINPEARQLFSNIGSKYVLEKMEGVGQFVVEHSNSVVRLYYKEIPMEHNNIIEFEDLESNIIPVLEEDWI